MILATCSNDYLNKELIQCLTFEHQPCLGIYSWVCPRRHSMPWLSPCPQGIAGGRRGLWRHQHLWSKRGSQREIQRLPEEWSQSWSTFWDPIVHHTSQTRDCSNEDILLAQHASQMRVSISYLLTWRGKVKDLLYQKQIHIVPDLHLSSLLLMDKMVVVGIWAVPGICKLSAKFVGITSYLSWCKRHLGSTTCQKYRYAGKVKG